MKMLYQRSNKDKRRKRSVLVALVVIVLVLVIVQPPVPRFLTSALHGVFQPVWSFQSGMTHAIQRAHESLQGNRTLAAQNESLRSELMSRDRIIARIHYLELENGTLRTLLRRPTSSDTVVPSTVIDSMTGSSQEAFVIDAGRQEEVTDNMLVVSPEGYALGIVATALNHTAIVRAFSSPGIIANALIVGTTTVRTRIEGLGGGSMHIRVPRGLPVEVGSAVIMPDFSLYVLGDVRHVEAGAKDAYQRVLVGTPVNIHELRHVYVDTAYTWNPSEVQVDQIATSSPLQDATQSEYATSGAL